MTYRIDLFEVEHCNHLRDAVALLDAYLMKTRPSFGWQVLEAASAGKMEIRQALRTYQRIVSDECAPWFEAQS